jgi:hypothetical protein
MDFRFLKAKPPIVPFSFHYKPFEVYTVKKKAAKQKTTDTPHIDYKGKAALSRHFCMVALSMNCFLVRKRTCVIKKKLIN